MNVRHDFRIQAAINTVLDVYRPRLEGRGKFGNQIHRSLTDALNATGTLYADAEDSHHLLPPGTVAWRSLLTCQPDPTANRRAIDIVVYHRGEDGRPSSLAALIEVESDLEDLWGSTSRNGFYTVMSLAKNANAQPFPSYKSLERMAVASLLIANPALTLTDIEAITGDTPTVHNPLSVPIYLVTGWCRETDHRELEPRLQSLGGELISGKVFPDRKSPRAFKQLLPVNS